MTRENTNTNEETMTSEEVSELITDYVGKGMKLYKQTKIRLVKRGFMLGLVTAVALQSLATIAVLLIRLT